MTSPYASPVGGILICAVYIACSATLINFNKFLMQRHRFPYAVHLMNLHMGASFVCGLVLYLLRPSLFPAMEKACANKKTILRYFLPIAVLFSVSVICSNEAYKHCSIAFLQCMKQANIVGVFLLSCLVGSQTADRAKLTTLAIVISGCSMAVTGEIHFSTTGFLIQAVSQLSEVSKIVGQEWILSGSDLKLDPLTFTIFMAPCCLFFTAPLSVWAWEPEIITRFEAWWPFLLANACLAFALNVIVSTLIKHLSALAFNLTGVVKDISIVLLSCYLFHDTVTRQQICGFSLAIAGINLWALMKTDPRHPIVEGYKTTLGMPSIKDHRLDSECVPLLRESKQP